MNNDTTFARPTEPRIRKQYVHLLDQFIAHGWDTAKIVGSFRGDYITADKVDRRRAFLNWDIDNPVVTGPSFEDLPLHRRPAPIVNTVDNVEDRERSRQIEAGAALDGRTVWAGFGLGWVAA